MIWSCYWFRFCNEKCFSSSSKFVLNWKIMHFQLAFDCWSWQFVPEAATSIWTGERLSENHKKSFSIDIHCRQHVDEKVKTSKRGDLSFDCRDPPQRTAWTRQPTVAFSQVGNHPYKELFLTLAFWGGLIFIVDFWRWIFSSFAPSAWCLPL